MAGTLVIKMIKTVLAILFLLIVTQTVIFAQERVYEEKLYSERIGTDRLIERLVAEPAGNGVVVLFADPSGQDWGNVLAHLSGVKAQIARRSAAWLNLINFVITAFPERKDSPVLKEYWFLSRREKLTGIKPLEIDWNNLKTKTRYAQVYHDYDDQSPSPASDNDFGPFFKALKDRPNYRVLITVDYGDPFLIELFKKDLRAKLKEFENRISYDNGLAVPDGVSGGAFHPVYNFYLVPNK